MCRWAAIAYAPTSELPYGASYACGPPTFCVPPGEPAGAEHAAHARQLVRPVGDEDRVAQPVADGGGAVLDVELERRAAGHRPVDVAVVDAEVLGQRDRVVDHHLVAAAGADIGVDRRLLDAAVGERPLHGERVVLHAVEVGGDGVVAQPDAGDDGRPVHPDSA
jgi:hypothetical protein